MILLKRFRKNKPTILARLAQGKLMTSLNSNVDTSRLSPPIDTKYRNIMTSNANIVKHRKKHRKHRKHRKNIVNIVKNQQQ